MSVIAKLPAAEVIRLLELAPHPEGGYFCEIFRDQRQVESGRAASTAIYFLLAAGERSHWHRVDATEVWHFYAGAPLVLEIACGKPHAISGSCSAMRWPTASGRKSRCRRTPGRQPRASASGRSPAARWRPDSSFPPLSSRRKAGGRAASA